MQLRPHLLIFVLALGIKDNYWSSVASSPLGPRTQAAPGMCGGEVSRVTVEVAGRSSSAGESARLGERGRRLAQGAS